MKWIVGTPEALHVAAKETSKSVMVHAMWLAVSRGCMSNQEEALDLCLTWINEARRAAGQKDITREAIAEWVQQRVQDRATSTLKRIP